MFRLLLVMSALLVTGCANHSTLAVVVEQQPPYDHGPTVRVELRSFSR